MLKNRRIVIGSLNPLKFRALNEALATCRLPEATEYDCVKVSSGVKTQPIGLFETEYGAKKRASAAVLEVAQGAITVGIENGLIQQEDGSWIDLAVIVLRTPEGLEIVERSGTVNVPKDYVDDVLHQGPDKVTVGEIVARQFPMVDPSDPHSFFTDKEWPREELLKNALVNAFRKLIEMNLHEEYHLKVAGVERRLRLHPILGGKRIALFDLMCDQDLNGRAGKELVRRLSEKLDDEEVSGVEALLMPEGKALGLFQEVLRHSKLPGVVARKTEKPYMLKPVLSATVRSITTQSEQKLYLSADDAAKLRGKKVAIVDDVVSTGASIDACKQLIEQAGGRVVAVAAVLTEGDPREDVISLGHLPIL